jgi:hypothetical protein
MNIAIEMRDGPADGRRGGTITKVIDLHQKVVKQLAQLQESGLYGFSVAETAERVICYWLADHQQELKLKGFIE